MSSINKSRGISSYFVKRRKVRMIMRPRDYDAKDWIWHMMTISEKLSCGDRDTSLGIVVGASTRTVIVSSGHQSPKF